MRKVRYTDIMEGYEIANAFWALCGGKPYAAGETTADNLNLAKAREMCDALGIIMAEIEDFARRHGRAREYSVQEIAKEYKTLLRGLYADLDDILGGDAS